MGERQCLEGLSRLPGLLLMGMVEPAKANAIRSALEALLRQHQLGNSKTSEAGLNGFDLIGVLRDRPDLVSLFEPLLTDEQLEILMKEAMAGDDEQA